MGVTRPILGKRMRHFQRYREIATVLFANGFGWFVDEIGLLDLIDLPKRVFANQAKKESVSTYERIRRTIEQLGPTFIKLGQIASLRVDLIPKELAEQLAMLQDNVPAIEFSQIRRVIESELGTSLDEVFRFMAETPVGSASIGQVHKGVLLSGETVAVKVQRPEVHKQVLVDLEVLADLARMAERHFEWARHYQVGDVVDEFRFTLTNELNYAMEGRNAEQIKKLHEEDSKVRVPSVYWDWSTERVLVMEYLEGTRLADRQRLIALGYDTSYLAQSVAHAVLTQILVHGMFHADPHPGNLAALPDQTILFMDFGMVGRLTSQMKRDLADIIVGLMRRNTEQIIRTLHRMGVVPADIDEVRLERDVDAMRQTYYDVPLRQVRLGQVTTELLSIAYQHRIKIPSALALVGKTLMTLEGVIEELDPEMRILDMAEPFGRALLRQRLDPRLASRVTFRAVADAFGFFLDIPRHVRPLLRELKRGKLRVEVEWTDLERVLNTLTRVSNRLSSSVLLLSLSIFVAGLMISSSLARNVGAIWRSPLTDVGLAMGIIVLVLLVWSILTSGRR